MKKLRRKGDSQAGGGERLLGGILPGGSGALGVERRSQRQAPAKGKAMVGEGGRGRAGDS